LAQGSRAGDPLRSGAMEGVAFLPRWQSVGSLGSPAAGSLVAAGALAAGSPLVASSPQLGLLRRSGTPGPTGRGWPRGLRPLFVDELPPRLEDCRGKIAALDRDLGRLAGDKVDSVVNSLGSGASHADELDSEVSHSARKRLSISGGSEREPEAVHNEDLAETLSGLEKQLLSLHSSWREVDEDRHRVEMQRDTLAMRAKASHDKTEAMGAEAATLRARLAELKLQREALRTRLGVSEADVKASQPLVEAAEERVQALATRSNDLCARLYTLQSDVETLQRRAQAEELGRAVFRQHEAERKQRQQAAAMAAEKVRGQFELQLAKERRAAEQRERELKLAIANVAQQQKAAEESIKRLTGEGAPAPPRWFRSAVPQMLTRRKRFAHGLMPAAVPASSGEPPAPEPPALDMDTPPEKERPAGLADHGGQLPEHLTSSSSAGQESHFAEEVAPGDEGLPDGGADEGLALDPEGLALLEVMMGAGMQTTAPELLHVSGLPSATGSQSALGTEGDAGFVPATCKVDLAEKNLCLQVLQPSGQLQKISLMNINTITRPDDARGAVDVDVMAAAEGSAPQLAAKSRRLRISAGDEDGASALCAGISLPDRILPGSCLISCRSSTSVYAAVSTTVTSRRPSRTVKTSPSTPAVMEADTAN